MPSAVFWLKIDLDLRKVPRTKDVCRNDFVLFSESNSRFLVEVAQKHRLEFEALMKDAFCAEVGKVKKECMLTVAGLDGKQVMNADLTALRRQWQSVLGAR